MRIIVVSCGSVPGIILAGLAHRRPTVEEILVATRDRAPFLDDAFLKSCEDLHVERLDRERESARIASELEPVLRRYAGAPAAGGVRHLVQMVSRAERRRAVLKRHAQRMRA